MMLHAPAARKLPCSPPSNVSDLTLAVPCIPLRALGAAVPEREAVHNMLLAGH